MENNATTVRNYYPTDIGNTWVLETPERNKRRIYTLEGPETINGEALIRLSIVTELLGTYTVETCQHFLSVTPERIRLHKTTLEEMKVGSMTTVFSPPATFFRLPLALGDKWNIETSTKLKGVLPAKIITNIGVIGSEQVMTPAGVFNDCFKIALKSHVSAVFVNMRSTTYQWLAPDVGPVKYQDNGGSVFALVNSNLLGATE